MRNYDLVVIGSGPAGQKAAIQAAKLGRSVAVIERKQVVGGVSTNTGTIPSKALREAALDLTGINKRGLFGQTFLVKRDITISDLITVSQQVIRHEWEVIWDQFDRNKVELVWGKAEFIDPHQIAVIQGEEQQLITADKFVIAIGTRPARPPNIAFDEDRVITSDEILTIKKLPQSLIVVGGGVVGVEYACIMATLGVHVTLIEGCNQVLGFLDDEITEAFQYQMRRMGITLRLGEKVENIEVAGPETTDSDRQIQATLESGKKLHAQTLLFAIGRHGNCGDLQLEKAGLDYDDRERLTVNEKYQTNVDHIYACGDVVGFPALASTAMEQGRLAACHAFGRPMKNMPELLPFGIYAVPEISMVGKTEQQLTQEGIPYEAGIAQYKEIARGQLLGDQTGMLKLLIHQEDLRILGVHIIGTGATELIHIGQTAMAFGGTVDFFINNVFNFPTLAECYKVAALNGYNKLT